MEQKGEWNLSSDSAFQVFPTPSVRLLHDIQKQSAEGSGERSSAGDRGANREGDPLKVAERARPNWNSPPAGASIRPHILERGVLLPRDPASRNGMRAAPAGSCTIPARALCRLPAGLSKAPASSPRRRDPAKEENGGQAGLRSPSGQRRLPPRKLSTIARTDKLLQALLQQLQGPKPGPDTRTVRTKQVVPRHLMLVRDPAFADEADFIHS
ncbi:hypothetical protein ACRRTK_020552 [Alexandromys fortis]